MPLRFVLLASALAVLLFAGCVTSTQTLPAPVARVDLDRYMGRWYVISHTPYLLERGKVASYDTYARRPDGRLTNNFTFREQTVDGPEKTWEGTARVIDPVSNAVWKVSFFWPVSVTYKIFALDPVLRDFDAAFALVGFTATPKCKAVSGKKAVTVRVVWRRRRDGRSETITVTASGERE